MSHSGFKKIGKNICSNVPATQDDLFNSESPAGKNFYLSLKKACQQLKVTKDIQQFVDTFVSMTNEHHAIRSYKQTQTKIDFGGGCKSPESSTVMWKANNTSSIELGCKLVELR